MFIEAMVSILVAGSGGIGWFITRMDKKIETTAKEVKDDLLLMRSNDLTHLHENIALNIESINKTFDAHVKADEKSFEKLDRLNDAIITLTTEFRKKT